MVEKAVHWFSLKHLKQLEWHRIFHMFYIEPIVFILLFAHTLSATVFRNQVIYQTCTTIFHYNASDCELLDSKNASTEINAIETELQPYVANLFLTRTLLESIVPAFCGLFVGSWSDHYGRKPLLVVSMFGFSCTFIINALICELSSYYWINPWWYILAAVPHSVLGGNCVFSVAAFCFISDVTDTKARPYRMICLEVLYFIGLISGSYLSSFVYGSTNATTTIGISGCLCTFATICIVCFLPESLKYKPKEQEAGARELEKCPSPKTSELQFTATDCGSKNIAGELRCTAKSYDVSGSSQATAGDKEAGLFSYQHIREMVSTCFKERDYNARTIIWLVTLAMFLSIFVFDGVITVMYLFVREKFHWTVREVTHFESVNSLVHMLGALVGFLVLRKLFKMSVVTLALLAFFSDILSNVVKGFANQTWHMYLSVFLGAFRSISGPMCRTIVSNIVPPKEKSSQLRMCCNLLRLSLRHHSTHSYISVHCSRIRGFSISSAHLSMCCPLSSC